MDEIIKEVKKIKIFIAIGSIALVFSSLFGAIHVFFAYKTYKPYWEKNSSFSYNNPEYQEYKFFDYNCSPEQEFFRNAVNLIIDGKFQELTNLATDQVAKSPSDAFGYYYLGLSYYYQGKYQEAIDNFKKVNQLSSSFKGTQTYIDKAQSKLKEK